MDDSEIKPDHEETHTSPSPVSGRGTTGISAPGYRILHEIHRGGQGIVYKAIQLNAHRLVALKLLHRSALTSIEHRKRFEREIDLTASLRHPNIVTLFDCGFTNQPYLVMEFVEGTRLDDFVESHKISVHEMLTIFLKVCDAIAYAHTQGVIHRDIKPSNILINAQGEPLVVDFGLAKLLEPEHPQDEVSITGEFLGTLSYASPEQLRGEQHRIDTRTDIYSLGVVLYWLLTGRVPFAIRHHDYMAFISERAYSDPPNPSTLRKEIDTDLCTIVLKALQSDPVRRYQTVDQLIDDINRFMAGEPVTARRDNITYILRKRLVRWASRHPVGIVAAVVIMTQLLVGGLLFSGLLSSTIDRAFERVIAQQLPTQWSGDVAVVAFNDDTYLRIPELVNRFGLTNVSQRNPKSWRSMHGQFMQTIAKGHPRVVVWDIFFPDLRPEYDSAFVKGMRELQRSGAPVVVGVNGVDKLGQPIISPVIAADVDGWGWITLHQHGSLTDGVLLAVDHPPTPLSPSLSLAGAMHFRQPQYAPIYLWDGFETLLVRFSRRSGTNPRVFEWSQEQELIDVSRVSIGVEFGTVKGTDNSRRTALRNLTVAPDRRTLSKATTPYHRVFDMKESELLAAFHNKVVLIGDQRDRRTTRRDRLEIMTTQGPREEYSVYLHAAAMNDLIAKTRLESARLATQQLLIGVAGLLGALIGLRYPNRYDAKRWIIVLVVCLSTTGFGAFLALTTFVLISPSATAIAFVVATVSCSLLWRSRMRIEDASMARLRDDVSQTSHLSLGQTQS